MKYQLSPRLTTSADLLDYPSALFGFYSLLHLQSSRQHDCTYHRVYDCRISAEWHGVRGEGAATRRDEREHLLLVTSVVRMVTR